MNFEELYDDIHYLLKSYLNLYDLFTLMCTSKTLYKMYTEIYKSRVSRVNSLDNPEFEKNMFESDNLEFEKYMLDSDNPESEKCMLDSNFSRSVNVYTRDILSSNTDRTFIIQHYNAWKMIDNALQLAINMFIENHFRINVFVEFRISKIDKNNGFQYYMREFEDNLDLVSHVKSHYIIYPNKINNTPISFDLLLEDYYSLQRGAIYVFDTMTKSCLIKSKKWFCKWDEEDDDKMLRLTNYIAVDLGNAGMDLESKRRDPTGMKVLFTLSNCDSLNMKVDGCHVFDSKTVAMTDLNHYSKSYRITSHPWKIKMNKFPLVVRKNGASIFKNASHITRNGEKTLIYIAWGRNFNKLVDSINSECINENDKVYAFRKQRLNTRHEVMKYRKIFNNKEFHRDDDANHRSFVFIIGNTNTDCLLDLNPMDLQFDNIMLYVDFPHSKNSEISYTKCNQKIKSLRSIFILARSIVKLRSFYYHLAINRKYKHIVNYVIDDITCAIKYGPAW